MIHILLVLALIPPALYGLAICFHLIHGVTLLLWRGGAIFVSFMVEALWTNRGARVVTFAWAGIGLIYGAKLAGLIR